MKNTNIEAEIGRLAIIHYQARKEVRRLKIERGKFGEISCNDYDEFNWTTDNNPKRKKITDIMRAFSDTGRIAKYKMTCLIKKII